MGIELPGGLTEALSWVGMNWPEGDETALDRVSDDWQTFGTAVVSIGNELQTVTQGLLGSLESGQTRDAFHDHLSSFFEGDKSLEELVKDAESLAEAASSTSNEVLALKIIYIAELIEVTIYVAAVAFSMFFGNAAGPAAIAARVAIARVAMRIALQAAKRAIINAVRKRAIKELLKSAAKQAGKTAARNARGIGLTVGVDTAIGVGREFQDQLIRNRITGEDFDVDDIIAAGVTSGVASLILSPVGAPLTKGFGGGFGGDGVSRIVTWNPASEVGAGVGNALTRTVDGTAVPESTGVDDGVARWDDWDSTYRSDPVPQIPGPDVQSDPYPGGKPDIDTGPYTSPPDGPHISTDPWSPPQPNLFPASTSSTTADPGVAAPVADYADAASAAAKNDSVTTRST
ncbi:hypothetical protein AAFP30_18435 [Gordonia sp. CPCC 205515]|uniref:WXG100-like domain-containing protein n=1 Tax=Gordonia sp. CPCC 205515 TaxID=3140791 RepID=UPI003AF36AD0